MPVSINPPFPLFSDLDGLPLQNGYIWFGVANQDPQTNPVSVYWDAALTIPADQPVRTILGFPANSGTPANLYVAGDYSMRVTNKNNSLLYSIPKNPQRILAGIIEGLTASIVSINASALYGGASNVQALMDKVSARTAGGVDIRWAMDHVYGSSWENYGGYGIGSDIGPAIDYLCDQTTPRTPIWLPSGIWRMVTPPDATKLSGRRVIGVGSQGSRVVYDNVNGAVFDFNGSGSLTGGGVSGVGILLEDGLGDTNAVAIRLDGSASNQADQTNFNDVYITKNENPSIAADSWWLHGFYAFGNDRTSPQGVRVAALDNVQIFKCRQTGVFLSNVVQYTLSNVGVYSGKSTGQNIVIAGGGTSSTNSIQVFGRGLYAQELNITNTSRFDITGTFSTFATDTSATSGRVFAFGATLSGTLGANVTFTSA